MSECVVRMEMPKRCKKCKIPLCLWVNDDWDVDDTIAAVQDFRKQNNDGFPDFCPIICSLPEGHGRLVDADMLKQKWLYRGNDGKPYRDEIDSMPTIVPAEAERSET